MSRRMIGAVIYEGPSMLDGSPIVVIVTGFRKSRNAKTGNLLQTWIMRSDMDPVAASKEGADDSICGDCPQRQSQGGACYVTLVQAPLTVWRAWQRGRYADWTARFPDNALEGRSFRFGSYGDPAAVPANIWRRVRSQKLAGWAGYTHQWRTATHLRPFLMASVDDEAEGNEAREDGWRTFRVRGPAELTIFTEEVDCPSDRVSCVSCGLCRGNARIAKSIVIAAHGSLVGRFVRTVRKRKLPIAG